MKQVKLQSRSHKLRPLSYACDLLLILLVTLAANGARAQQNAPATAAASQQAGQPASQTVTTGPGSAAASQVRVPAAGAPVMGFRGPAAVKDTATSAPAKPAVQAAAAPGPRLDPITHAPISSSASRPAAEVSPEVGNKEGGHAGEGSLQQGLKVHGHWVIDVRNPDGTLVQHHEFENSLEPSAQGFMVGLLSGYLVPGDWMIVMGAQSGSSSCNGPSFGFCGLVHNAATFPAQGYCGVYYCTGSTLSYSYNFGSGGLGGPFSIVLSGSITANQTGTIGTVYTLLNTCANIAFTSSANPSSIETNSPASCVTQSNPAPWYGPFTETNITPIPVTSGQLVQAIVTITFS